MCVCVAIVTYYWIDLHFYRPQMKLREGNVFTGVCDSVHGGGCLLLGGLVRGRGWWCLLPGGGFLDPGGISGPRGVCSQGVSGPGVDTPPDSYCRGRYASHWNAFLYNSNFAFLISKDVLNILLEFETLIIPMSFGTSRHCIFTCWTVDR